MPAIFARPSPKMRTTATDWHLPRLSSKHHRRQETPRLSAEREPNHRTWFLTSCPSFYSTAASEYVLRCTRIWISSPLATCQGVWGKWAHPVPRHTASINLVAPLHVATDRIACVEKWQLQEAQGWDRSDGMAAGPQEGPAATGMHGGCSPRRVKWHKLHTRIQLKDGRAPVATNCWTFPARTGMHRLLMNRNP